MAARTYSVGSLNKVVRLDDHTGSWIDISPTIGNPNVTWFDVKTDPTDGDKVTIVGAYLGGGTGILTSTDAGQTWNIPGGSWTGAKFFYQLWYVDSNIIWVTGSNGRVAKSTDGGLTFNLVPTLIPLIAPATTATPATSPGFTNAIHAISDQIAVVTGSHSELISEPAVYAWKTIDGGNSWIPLNGGASLVNTVGVSQPVGRSHSVWMSADGSTIIAGTGYTQNLSTDGGYTWQDYAAEFTRSGRHMTWFPDYTPTTFRHLGGPSIHVSESTDTGLTWTATRSAEGIDIRAGHFYTINNGYYTIGHRIYSTSTAATTGVQSYQDPNPDLVFEAIWTGEKTTQPCYIFTPCDTSIEPIIWYDPILAQYVGSYVELTILTSPSITMCGEFSMSIDTSVCFGAIPSFDSSVYSIGDVEYADCDACSTPPPNVVRCYDLISCDEVACPSMYGVTNSELGPYVGQYITIDSTGCRYLVQTNRQAYFNTLQVSDLSDPLSAFQLGTENWTIEITSIVLNGTEYVTSAYTPYILTNVNYSVSECTGLTCTPVTVGTTENCISNFPSYYNQAFNNFSVPGLTAECTDPALNCGGSANVMKIQYTEGSTFAITATYTSNLGTTYQVVYQVTAGNVSQVTYYYPLVADSTVVDTCNDIIYCTGEDILIDATYLVTYSDCGNTSTTQPELGESCDIKPRLGEPGFSAKFCDPEKIINVKCKFGDSVYALFKRMRYGIETCCEFDLDKIYIKNALIDFGYIYDPDVCVVETPVEECCFPPCDVVVQILVPNYLTCPAPTNGVAVLALAAAACDPPTEANAILSIG